GAVPVERRPAPDPGADRAGTEDTDDLIDRLIDGPADALPSDVLPATDDEGYDPPVPPPLPRASSQTVVAVLAIVAGLVIFFQPGVLGLTATFGLVLGITSILGGFGALVWRLRDGFADDDDGDDGARV
ncbi:MAG: DUF308 domain-containing protein, partial [Pseudonocardia sp.]|nr:DUF308 domain-containing protein [Pseudonocardia sp.]